MGKDIRDNLLFAGIDTPDVDQFLVSLPAPIHLKKSEFLWRQNDPGDSMYLLKTGKLDVVINYNAPVVEEIVIAGIDAGAVIGEVSVFGEKIRSAGIRAAEDAELLVIDGEKFREDIQRKNVAVLIMCYNVAKLLTQRLMSTNDFIRKLQALPDKTAVKSELEHYRQRFTQESLFN